MVALTFHLFKWSTPHQPTVGAIAENIPLSEFTTFGIGGKARYFSRVKSVDELKEALAFARSKKLPIFVLGGGSNVLVSDEGFEGLVIKIEIVGVGIGKIDSSARTHIRLLADCSARPVGLRKAHSTHNFSDFDASSSKESDFTRVSDASLVIAGAGVIWDELVAYSVKENLHGLENLSLIPGTVGGATVQNIGAYGAEVKDFVEWVEAIHQETGEIKRFSNTECQFGYRFTFFKIEEGKKYIITQVAFKLSKDGPIRTDYKDITDYISNHNLSASDITLQKIRSIIIDIRTKKLPNLGELGTAGSFFKNIIVSKEKYSELVKKFPEIVSYPASGENVKLSAAWVLDKICGLKGYREGDAGVYKNQALVLVNFGSASAKDIKSLSEKMVSSVYEKTGVTLEREVEYVGK